MITKEESIKKTNEFIYLIETANMDQSQFLKNMIEDIETCKKDFVDYDESMIGGNEENLLGVMDMGSRLEYLFCEKYNVFTKSVPKNKHK
jgi:hypothetical protein